VSLRMNFDRMPGRKLLGDIATGIEIMAARFPFAASPPRFAPPPKACDCHIHVFGPAVDYPYEEGRTYTPSDALPEDGLTMLRTLGMGPVVLVQPSIYGTHSSRMPSAMATSGKVASVPAFSTMNCGHEGGILVEMRP
jgi:hypothetical protein